MELLAEGLGLGLSGSLVLEVLVAVGLAVGMVSLLQIGAGWLEGRLDGWRLKAGIWLGVERMRWAEWSRVGRLVAAVGERVVLEQVVNGEWGSGWAETGWGGSAGDQNLRRMLKPIPRRSARPTAGGMERVAPASPSSGGRPGLPQVQPTSTLPSGVVSSSPVESSSLVSSSAVSSSAVSSSAVSSSAVSSSAVSSSPVSSSAVSSSPVSSSPVSSSAVSSSPVSSSAVSSSPVSSSAVSSSAVSSSAVSSSPVSSSAVSSSPVSSSSPWQSGSHSSALPSQSLSMPSRQSSAAPGLIAALVSSQSAWAPPGQLASPGSP